MKVEFIIYLRQEYLPAYEDCIGTTEILAGLVEVVSAEPVELKPGFLGVHLRFATAMAPYYLGAAWVKYCARARGEELVGTVVKNGGQL